MEERLKGKFEWHFYQIGTVNLSHVLGALHFLPFRHVPCLEGHTERSSASLASINNRVARQHAPVIAVVFKAQTCAFHRAMPPHHRSLQRISPATPPAGPHSPSPVCLLPVSHSGCGDAPALSSHRLTTPSGAVTAFNFPKLSREHSTRVAGLLLRMSLKPRLSHSG